MSSWIRYMVSPDNRNNIIVMAVLIGFSLMIVSFIHAFVSNMERATVEVGKQVNTGVANVTDASEATVGILINLTKTIDKQLVLQQEEKETQEKNLAKFMGAFSNQSKEMVDTINELNKDSNASREKQTQIFVETLEQSQNLTKANANLTVVRNAIEVDQNDKIDELIRTFNLTLTPIVDEVLVEKQNITTTGQASNASQPLQ